MDDYNRATTALVSTNNTVNIPCSKSAKKNEIIATIPTSQKHQLGRLDTNLFQN